MTAQVVLHRAGGWCDMMRAYRVVVDGEDWGTLKRNSEIALDMPPGAHDIMARIDCCGSNVLHVDLAENETLHLDIANPHKPWQINRIMTKAPDTYLQISVR